MTTLVAFAVASTALVAVPGPNLVYIVTRSAVAGRRVGIASALGVETGTLVWIAGAALGLAGLIASSPIAFNAVKWAGVAYLIYLGLGALRPPRTITGQEACGDRRSSLSAAFLQGLMVNVLNPKVALFFIAFFPLFVDPRRDGIGQVVLLGAIFFVIALAIDLAYAMAAGGLGGWLSRRITVQRRAHQFAGVVYLGLGTLAALSGGR